MTIERDIHLRSFEVKAIAVQQGLWWVIYRVRGQRSGLLSEAGVVAAPWFCWLYPLLASADEEVRLKDRHFDKLLGLVT